MHPIASLLLQVAPLPVPQVTITNGTTSVDVNAYGVLAYCVENGVQKFTPKEFAEKFPELVIPGVRSGNYYIDVEETDDGRKSRLGFMLVDYGTSPETIVKKVRRIVSRGYTLPAFARLIQRGSFVVAIIAPSSPKVTTTSGSTSTSNDRTRAANVDGSTSDSRPSA